ncbi:MAG: ECF transporter S component [Bacilli bacterium]|nr:ECF transporter S component [Bacilli bacterium]
MNKFLTTKTISALGILTAITVALQAIGNIIPPIFGVTINLTLIPVCIAACLYGPLAGLWIGFINGVMVLFAPSTIALFFPWSGYGTVITCLTKSAIAGLVAGFVFKALKNKNDRIGCIIASLLVPVINTSLFLLYCQLFFINGVKELAGDTPVWTFMIVSFVGLNFVVELLINGVLSPVVYSTYTAFQRKNRRPDLD